MSAASSASSLSAQSPGAAKLRFNSGMPGFPGAKNFSLRSWGTEESPFYVLECQDVLGLRFVVVGPGCSSLHTSQPLVLTFTRRSTRAALTTCSSW